MTIPEIETARLILRGPTGGDVDAWATYLELLGELTDIQISSPMTAVYSMARDQFSPGDAVYRVTMDA